MSFSAALAFAHLLVLAQASPQLLPPSALPTVAANFRLVAHALASPQSDLASSIENREVTASTSDCDDAYATLSDGISSGLSFFWDPDTTSIQSGTDSHSIGFLMEGEDSGGVLKLSCGQGSSGVGISPMGNGPELELQNDAQAYACQTTLPSGPAVQLLYRNKNATALPNSCVDVALYAECADGPRHGDNSLAVCCFDVKDGDCRVSF